MNRCSFFRLVRLGGLLLMPLMARAQDCAVVINEIHYHPAGGNAAMEFIELLNPGTATLDLTSVQFTAGIAFNVASGATLAGGQRLLIVKDVAAFIAAYPTVPPAQIAGIFANAGALDNAGDHLTLIGANGVIVDFSYEDSPPWPAAPDGDGPSLVLMNPAAGSPITPTVLTGAPA